MDEDEFIASPVSGNRSISRVLGLSDGVFAIALTLLVLNLDLPPGTNPNDVADALEDMLPEVGAYALSFAVIAMFWVGHHRLFNVVADLDHRLIVFNLAYLGLIALIPFPTEVFGSFDGDVVPTVVYASSMSAAGLLGTLLWMRVLRAGLADPQVHRTYLVHGIWRGLSLGGVFLVSVPVAVISPSAAQISWLSIGALQWLLSRRFGSIHRLPRVRH